MIALSPQNLWLRVAPSQRPLLCLALFLFSLSGLVTGMALRPLLATGSTQPHHAASVTAQIGTAPMTAATATTAQSTSVAAIPERFSLSLSAFPLAVHAGQTVTFTVQTNLIRAATMPATGVMCSVVLQHTTLMTTQATDAAGTTLWHVVIPTDLAPGTYNAQVSAQWGSFTASFDQVGIRVS